MTILRRRMMTEKLGGDAETPLYPLDGTYNFSNGNLTISGNHWNFALGNGQTYYKLCDIPYSKLYFINNQIRVVVTNYDESLGNNIFQIELGRVNSANFATIRGTRAWQTGLWNPNEGNGDWTWNFQCTQSTGTGLYITKKHSGFSCEFDFEVYVNNERWF